MSAARVVTVVLAGALCAQPALADAPHNDRSDNDRSLVGRYVLRNAGGAESELHVREDRGFKAVLRVNGTQSLGLVFEDSGSWRLVDDHVLLTVDRPSAQSSAYVLSDSLPWSDTFDWLLEELEADARREEVARHCPFLLVEDESESPLPFDLEKLPAQMLQARADASLILLREAEAALTTAMLEAVAARGDDERGRAEQAAEEARAMMRRYFAARADASSAQLKAGREPLQSSPRYPGGCVPQSSIFARRDVRLPGGHAVGVLDGEVGLDRGVEVVFEFDDGMRVARHTTPGGYAMVPRRPDVRLRRIGIRPPIEGFQMQYVPAPPPETVPLLRRDTPASTGVLLDGAFFDGAFFDGMRLRIEGRDLVPIDAESGDGWGRYVRE